MQIVHAEIKEIITTGNVIGKVRPFSLNGNSDGGEHFVGTGVVVDITKPMQKCTIIEEHLDSTVEWNFILFDNNIRKAYPVYVDIMVNSYNIPDTFRSRKIIVPDTCGISRNGDDVREITTLLFTKSIIALQHVLNKNFQVGEYVTLPELMIQSLIMEVETPDIRNALINKERDLRRLCSTYVNEMPFLLARTTIPVLAHEIRELCELEKKLTNSDHSLTINYLEAHLPLLRKKLVDWRIVDIGENTNSVPPIRKGKEDSEETKVYEPLDLRRFFRIVPNVFYKHPNQLDNDTLEPRMQVDVENATYLVENPLEHDEIRDLYLLISQVPTIERVSIYTLLNIEPIVLVKGGTSFALDISHFSNTSDFDVNKEMDKKQHECMVKFVSWIRKNYPEFMLKIKSIVVKNLDGEIVIVGQSHDNETLVVYMDRVVCSLATHMIAYK